MPVRAVFTVSLIAVATAGLNGCRSTNPAMSVPIQDEYIVPPDDPRYNQPPESAYKPPPAKMAWGAPPTGGSMSMNGQ